MKKIITISAVALASALASAATPEEIAAREAQKKLDAEFKALSKECGDLANKDFNGALAAYWDTNTRAAIAKWEEALKDPKWTNGQRISMLAAIADRQLNVWYEEKLALGTAERMLKLPGLTAAEKADAQMRLADLKRTIGVAGDAEVSFYLSVANDEKVNPGNRNAALGKAVQTLGEKDKAKAWALLMDKKYDGSYNIDRMRLDMSAKFGPEGESKRMWAAKRAAYDKWLGSWDGKSFNNSEFTENKIGDWSARGFDAFKAEFPGVARSIVAKCTAAGRPGAVSPSVILYNWAANPPWNDQGCLQRKGDFRKFVYDMLMDKSCGTNTVGDAQLMNFLAAQKETKALAVPYARKIVAASKKEGAKVDKKAVDAAFVIAAFDGTDGNARKIVAAAKSVAEFRGQKDDKQALAKLIAERASAELKGGDEKCARALLEEYEKFVPSRPQSHLNCEYWPDAPQDLATILASDRYKKVEKGILGYPYGDNLKFLIETDSALMGREMTTDNGEKFRPTELFAFFDRNGVRIILRSFEDMTAVKAGFGTPAGYEAYLSPGVEAPYWCYMFSPVVGGKADMSDGFLTQYANGTGFRPSNQKSATLFTSYAYLDDGAATMLSIPWYAAFMYTPDREKAWFFEPINWSHGGRSWGGSTSVHYRSSFGALEFKGADKAALTAIRRQLLPRAKAAFDAACSSRDNSPFDRWQDNVLGDQEFYLAKVKPFRERLAAYLNGKRIKVDMTDDDVNEIYEAVAIDAFNCRYIIAQMRADWLEEKRARGE